MIKATSTRKDVHIEIEGNAMDVMSELSGTISSVYDLLKQRLSATDAELEIQNLMAKAIRYSEGKTHEK